MKARTRTLFVCLALILLVMAAACNGQTPEATSPPDEQISDAAAEPQATEPPATEPPATEPPATEPPAPEQELLNMSADPVKIEFTANDGKNLVGYYYPPKYVDSPLVVLMHWAGGDACTWADIAPWLQNRMDENPTRLARCADRVGASWLEPSWFPAMPVDISFGVFVFDFRDFGESEKGLQNPEEWQDDARSAMLVASGQPGADPNRVASIGTSIGADGAIIGCALYNASFGSGCLGALSLSPGSYLGPPYSDAVTLLEDVGAHAWCMAAEDDYESPATCNSASGDNYQVYIFPGDDHGPQLLRPDLDPNPMVLVQNFLEIVFGIILT